MKPKLMVKPLDGMKVRKPAADGGTLLLSEGELVPDNTYWQRRLRAGDVMLVSQAAPVETVEAQPKSKKVKE